MHARLAEAKDIPQLIKLGRELLEMHFQFDNSYYQIEENFDESFSNWIQNTLNTSSQFIFVAENNDKTKIIGFISGFIKPLYPWFKIKSVGHISYLFVHSQYRKQRVGKSLEKKAVEWFKSKNITYLELYVDEKNTSGQYAWNSYAYEPFKKFLRKSL